MKSLRIVSCFLLLSVSSFSQKQDVPKSHKFQKENIFIGGGIGLGLGSGSFSAGLNPEIGYTVVQWLDAGIAMNFNYNSITAEYNQGLSLKSFNYGGGIFARVYPINGLFLQVLPEYNIIRTTYKNVFTQAEGDFKQEAPSLLLGIGYSSREVGRSNFYTVLMIDAGNNTNSPYIGSLGSKLPILRTGINFYLSPKRK